MYEDLVLTYNRACGITCNTVVTEEREKKQMAKPSVDKNREALRAKRREQARELNEFCKARGICVRCKNPDKKVVVASTLCEGCKGYYKQYSSTMRSKSFSRALSAARWASSSLTRWPLREFEQ